MQNEIKSAIVNKDNLTNLINKVQINNLSELENNINNLPNAEKAVNNNLEKVKGLLQNLLKKSFEPKLTLLEKDTRIHFIKLHTTNELIKETTNITKRMVMQVQEKIKKSKEKQSSKRPSRFAGTKKPGLSPHKSAISNTRNNFYRAKTPSHISKGNNAHNKSSIMGLKRELIKSKSNMALMKSSKTIDVARVGRRNNNKQKNMGNKSKTSINFKKYINPNDSNLDELQTISVTSIKTNKTNTTTLNTISNSRINNKYPFYKSGNKMKKQNTELTLKQNIDKAKLSKMLNAKKVNNFDLSEKNLIHYNKNKNNLNTDEKHKRKKTPFNKKIGVGGGKIDSAKISPNSKKKEKTVEDEIDDILSMECNIQKETILNNNDPLLILPLKDLDFVPKGLLRRNSVRNDGPNKEKKYILSSSFDIQKKKKKIKFNNIFKYLSLCDVLSIKNISKKFRLLIILYLIEVLKKEKNNIIEIKDNLIIKEVPNRETIENLPLSKGSKKAIELLNESQLNSLFKDGKMPINDIILIYRIYFQIINHPFALVAKTDLDKFWEKCTYYFTNEQDGKTGDILISMLNKKKIDINGNNLYQIYNLVKGNLNKIVPNYFSSICGTTGLFVFVIKDILEFLGISQKIKQKENAFWTYSDIEKAIDEKINYLKNFKI